MFGPRRLLSLVAMLVVLLLGETAAPAAIITQTRSVGFQNLGLNDSSSLVFDRFDTSLGTLSSIGFQLVGHVEGSVGVENLGTAARTISTTLSATLTLTRPDASTLLITTPTASTSDDLAAFDGIMDFGGASGRTHNNLFGDLMTSLTGPTSAADLALFSAPGTIALSLTGVSTSTDIGGANVLTSFDTSASASIVVVYNYLAAPNPLTVPEPSSLAVVGVGAGCVLLFGHWRRRTRRVVV